MENKDKTIEATMVAKSQELEKNTKALATLETKVLDVVGVYKKLPSISNYVANIKEEVTDENKEEVIKLGKQLNKLKGLVAEERKSWYKDKAKGIDQVKDGLMEFEKLLEVKRENLLSSYQKNEKKIYDMRYLYFNNYFDEVKSAYDLFDWVTFVDHIKEDFMKKESAFGTKGDIKKSSKEKVLDKLRKFDSDKKALGDDLIAISQYQANGFDLAKAVAFSNEQKALIKRQEEERILREAKAKEEAETKEKQVQMTKEDVVITKTTTTIEKNDKNTIKFEVEVPVSKADAFERNIIGFKFDYKREE